MDRAILRHKDLTQIVLKSRRELAAERRNFSFIRMQIGNAKYENNVPLSRPIKREQFLEFTLSHGLEAQRSASQEPTTDEEKLRQPRRRFDYLGVSESKS